jgi:hypothetical protein
VRRLSSATASPRAGPLEDLEMHRQRVQRTAQIVKDPREVRGQRLSLRIVGRLHQLRRADFTAWMPYFASLL